MPTKRQVRRKRAARQVAQPRTQGKEVQLEQSSTAVIEAPAAARPHTRARVRERFDAAIAHRRFPVLMLAAIFLASVLVYTWVGRKYLFPNLFPDEMIYGKMSQNFAAGNGLEWRGSGHGLPPLWPVILSSIWHFGSTPEAYGNGKVLCSILASLTVIPTWLLARSLVGSRLALVAAALSVTGAWMALTVFLATENLVYPIATASLAALVTALRKTSVRWLVVSLAFSVVAVGGRTQMLSLFVVTVVALGLDVLRHPRAEWRVRIDAWPRFLWIGLIAAVSALLLVFILKPGATNYDVLAHHASIGKVAATAGRHGVAVIVAFAIIPVVAAFALMFRASNWRDDTTGPLLVTLVAATLVFIPVIARFETWATGGIPVERYTMYLAPLACIALVLAPGRISRKGAALAGLLVLAALWACPIAVNNIEQPGLYGLQKRIVDIFSPTPHTIHLAIVLVSLPFVAAAVVGLTTRRRRNLGFAVTVLLVVFLMANQSWAYHDREAGIEHAVRHEVAPAQYDWVDTRVDGPVAMLAIGKGEPMHQNIDLYTDFFNKRIGPLYSTEPVGVLECEIDFKPHGYFKFDSGVCPAWPRYLVMLERSVHMTLRHEDVLAQTTLSGRLVKIPPGEPRMLGLVKPPCTPDGCDATLQIGVYLDDPANVSVTFGASDQVHRIQTGNQVRSLPAGHPNTINFSLPKGDQAVNIPVDWTTPDGPAILSVLVKTKSLTQRIF